MIDYNQKLSNERETQVPSHRMSTLVLLETLIFIKIVSVSVMLFYVQYQIPQQTQIDSPLYTLMDFFFWSETINLGRSIVNIKGSRVIIPK